MIANAILAAPEKKLCLQEVYESIEKAYPYFRTAHPGWRNSVRHNLSLHECFCKGERCENGKGHYWCIHPANLQDFLRGDFRRRLIKSRIRRSQTAGYHPYNPEVYCSYVPLQYYHSPTTCNATLPYPVPLPYVYAYYPTPSELCSSSSSGPHMLTENMVTGLYNLPHSVNNAGVHVHSRQLRTQHRTENSTSTAYKSGNVGGNNGALFSVKNILSTPWRL